MSDPLAWIDAESAAWDARGLRRHLTATDRLSSTRVIRQGRGLVNFSTNDYLGLAHDPRVIAAAVAAVERQGFGSGASPLVSGWGPAHEGLVEALGRFERTEAVALFPSGFAANLGTIAALVSRGDAVYLDRLNHACLVDGARLSGATLRVYPHNDVERLAALLERDRGRFRRSLVATDGVFSMDGDLAPLDRLVDLAEQFDAMLLVDEAHGTGVFGPDGRGAGSVFGVCDRVPIRVGTLSKALGSLGGFVAGSQRLVDWLVHRAHSLMFSTALPASAAAAATQALAIVEAEPARRLRVRAEGIRLADALRALGYRVPEVPGPIVPVLLGPSEAATALASRLQEAGLLVPAIRPPTVPQGTARLRISLSAAHTADQVDRLIQALTQARNDDPALLALDASHIDSLDPIEDA